MKAISVKSKAIHYRKNGYSYSMIIRELNLSKSTLSNWLKEIPFHPNKEVLARIKGARSKMAETKSKLRIKNIGEIKSMAREELGKIGRRDLWMLGIGLYLGEGMKSRESIRIINSDPRIIKVAIRWFIDICGLNLNNIRVAIHIYPDNDINETLNYWSKITRIPIKQFGKTQIDRRINKSGKKKGLLPYGTAHLTIKANGKKEFGVILHRRIMGWIETTLE